MKLMPVNRRFGNAAWFAVAALVSILSCACRPSSGFVASPERSVPKDPSEQIKEIPVSQLKDWMTTGQAFTLIDVRTDDEWQAGHAAAAVHIPRPALFDRIATVAPDKTARIVLYCLGGARSAAGAAFLQRMGYTNVFSLAGGFKKYKLAGLPIRK